MTAQDLKNSILQLAVQGKLVPQCKEDEPASELLKRIFAEKAKLGIKEKPLPEITDDEIPFDIPENWKWVRLNTISSITSGGTPARTNSTFWNGNIPWVKIGDIKDKYVLSTEEKITEQGLNSCSAKIFPQKAILYTIFATIGTVGILGIEAATNQAVAGITFYGEYDLDYMYYVLVGLKDILVSKGKGMAQMNINQSILKNTPIPIPPLAEQKRIVAKIEELLPMVEEYGKAQEQLATLNAEFPDKLRKSILQQAVQGKLTERDHADEPAFELINKLREERKSLQKNKKAKKSMATDFIDEEELPFDAPDNWVWIKLGWICQKIGAGSTPKGGNTVYVKEGIKFLREQNIHNDGLKLNDVAFIDEKTHNAKSGSKVEAKDILMNITGGSIGRNSLVPDDFDTANINQHVLIIRLVNKEMRQYLHYCFLSPTILNQMFAKQAGDKPGLSATKVENFLIPIPPLAEQKRIVKRVDELLALCQGLK